MNHMPHKGPMEDYGMGYGPAAGYEPGPGMPSVPTMDDIKE